MTDRSPDLDDAALKADLDGWFQGEVRQAAADLRRAPLRPARARVVPARGVAGPALAATLVVLLVIAGISRLSTFSGPAAEPTEPLASTATSTSPQPTATFPTTGSPAPSGGLGDRYQDGIPAFIDGEFVRRLAKVGGSSLPNDGSSFLIGGWLLHPEATRLCSRARSPLEPCGLPVLASTPLENPDAPSVYLGNMVEDPVEAVVFRVHANDPRAADCLPARVVECRAVLVVEGVLWSDDAVTKTTPISTIHVMNRLQSLVPELALYERAINPRLFDPALTCDPGLPVQTWTTSASAIAMILVFPSAAARDAVDDNFNASGWRGTSPGGGLRPSGALSCLVTIDSFYSHAWVVGQNVMVAVQVNVDGATHAQQALVDGVTEAFREP